MYHQFKELADVDITAEPMEIGPTCHYVMGGVEVDPDTQESSVTGLYAVGECSGGMHGSNRLGGNSLGDLLVFGKRAGEHAAEYARRARRRPAGGRPRTTSRRPQASALAPFEVEGGENPYTIQQDLQQSMNDLVGIIRDGDELEQALEEIETFKERAKSLVVEGHRQYNPGWHLAIDLRNMLIVSECIAKAALARAGVPRRPHPRRLPADRHDVGARRTSSSPSTTSGDGVELAEKPLPEMPDDLKTYFEASELTMGYNLKMRRLARRPERRRPPGLHGRGLRGRGRPRRDPPRAGHAGRRPRRALELQGRQVRLLLGRDQRQAQAAVHVPALGLRRRPRRSRSPRCGRSR